MPSAAYRAININNTTINAENSSVFFFFEILLDENWHIYDVYITHIFRAGKMGKILPLL
jgi:hypothetical protein